MRPHSDQLAEVLKGSHSRRLIVDVFHGSDRVAQDLPMQRWQLDGDLNAEIKHSGSGTIVYSSLAGESLVPTGTEGILSPFRARLLLLMEITAGTFSETITLGWRRIESIPSAYDVYHNDIVTGSVVEITFQSMELDLRRRGFRFPESPPATTSCYAELRRISGVTVVETLPDKAFASFVYETAQGGRLKGIQALAAELGGVAVIDSTGSLRVLPKAAGDPVGALSVGPDGTVTDVGYSMETEGVYNAVVGTFEDDNRNPIYAVAQVTDGPLAVTGAYGEYTREYSSPLVKTQAGADSAVAAILANSISGQQYDVPIQCITNPLVELGDQLELLGHVRDLEGKLTQYSMDDSALMGVNLEAWRAL